MSRRPLRGNHTSADMRTAAALVLLAVVAVATVASPVAEGDKIFLSRQREVLRLFIKVQQPTVIPEHAEIIKSFKWDDVEPKHKDPATVDRFLQLHKHEMLLERNEDFSILYKKHMWQAIQLFKVLFGATDFDTFHKVAVWARYHVNEGMFTYVLTVALMHRDDTRNFMLPPPYEVLPQFFITSDAIQRAYEACLRGLCTDEEQPYIVRANYTGYPVAHNTEAKLSYFREDVGLASYMAFTGQQYVSWLNSSDCHWPILKQRGELYYFMVHNLLARYDLERFSNHMLPVTPVDLWEPVSEGYDPKLRLLSGREAAARPEGLRPSRSDALSLEDLIAWERRVRDVAATGLFLNDKTMKDIDPNTAINTLGFILMGGPNSPAPNYYRSVSWGLQSLYGHIADPLHKYEMAPSALDMHLTMYRDPLYYRIIKRVYGFFDVYKDNQPPYQRDDMIWEGVKITEMKFDKLITFFDEFDVRLDNAIDVPTVEDIKKVNVIARQRRLNHRPFSYSLKITSDTEKMAFVRVYLGPHGPWDGSTSSLEDLRHDFLVIDGFHIKLKPGENSAVRKSREFLGVAGEPPTFPEMYRRVEAALEGKEKLVAVDEKRRHEGYPHRLLLPRGRPAGLPLVAFAIVTEAHDPAWEGQVFSDSRDPFFPFDRRVFYWDLRTLPNAHFEPVTIFHRMSKDSNAA